MTIGTGFFKDIPIRYFIYSYDDEPEGDLIEVTELDFIEHEGTISYERHTMFANGASQICLTKSN